MPVIDPIPATPVAPAPHTRGYFNQTQLDNIAECETVLAAARFNHIVLAELDITDEYLDVFSDVIGECHSRLADVTHTRQTTKSATATSTTTAKALHLALQRIQSAAKQKHRMLIDDGDPNTNFSTDGHLIGQHLTASRATLIQSAVTLITRATENDLPGFRTPDKVAVVQNLLTAYRAAEDDQLATTSIKETSRLTRDQLLVTLSNRRSAIQHAADSIWLWNDEANRPVRKTFLLPLTRPLGL